MEKTTPGIAESGLPILILFLSLLTGALVVGFSDALLISSLLFAAIVAGTVAFRHGFGWDDVQAETGAKLSAALPAIIILLAIGILIGSWMFSGTIPALVYYGIEIISPRFIVLTAFLATAAMSLASGTSWGSAGTIGVALMATAAALEAPLAITAGAVVSGAYFGDKMSPISDSTNISAIGAGSDLYDHIAGMVYTAGPSFVVAFAVYLIAGFSGQSGKGAEVPEAARQVQTNIASAFDLGLLPFIPPAIAVIGMIRRYPAALVILASSVAALAVGMTANGFSAPDALKAAINGFNVEMLGNTAASLSDSTKNLLNRGGMASMAFTLLFIVSAFLMAAAMEVSGALGRLLNAMLAKARSVFTLIAATMAAGATLISMTSHGGVTALIVGNLFRKPFDDMHLSRRNLSRSIEDSVTIVEPLLPWTVSAVFMATTLGVPTVEYAPWAFFCFTGSLFSLGIAFLYKRTGFGIRVNDQ